MLKPKNKIEEVMGEALAADRAGRFFLDADMRWHRWLRDIAPLKEKERGEWDNAAGILYSMVGRFDDAHRCFENSLRIAYSPQVVYNFIQSTISSGQYLRAQELYQHHGHPKMGNFERLIRSGLACGAYAQVLSYIAAARDMGITVPHLRGSPDEVAEFLLAQKIPDADVALHLEAAGKIAARHRVKTQLKRVIAGDQKPVMLSILFVVAKSGDEVFEMNIELAQAEEEMGIKKQLAFDVAFVEALESDETESG